MNYLQRSILLCCVALDALSANTESTPVAPAQALPDVLVVADAVSTDLQLRPTADKPIYYAIIGKVEDDIGYPYAGSRTPDHATIHRELVDSLASQGYREAQLGGPRPQIALFVSWGQANLDGGQLIDMIDFGDSRIGESTSQTLSRPINQNTRQLSRLTGANKLDWSVRNSEELDLVREAVQHDRLYIMVAALDAEALAKKEKKLLWRTRLSIDAYGWNLNKGLVPMLADAAPYFGRNEARPVLVNEQVRKADVTLGELKILDPEVKPRTEAN